MIRSMLKSCSTALLVRDFETSPKGDGLTGASSRAAFPTPRDGIEAISLELTKRILEMSTDFQNAIRCV
jgi:hypothetical protein